MQQRKSAVTTAQQPPQPPAPIKLDRFTLLHLRLYQLLGLCAVPLQLKCCDLVTVNQRPQQQSHHLSMSQTQNRFLLLWHCLHFICFILIHLWSITNHDSILYNSDGFGKFNDLIKLSATIISHIVILSETLFRRQCMYKFLLLYTRLHDKWFRSHTYGAGYRLYYSFFWKSLIFITITFTIVINYVWEISNNRRWLSFFIPFTPSGITCQIRSVQIVHFIELLRIELEQLNKNVERLIEFSRRRVVSNPEQQQLKMDDFDRRMCAELQMLMKNYQDIYEMCSLLKQSVSMSIAFNYLKEYIMILSECYWSYWMYYNGEDIIEYTMIIPSAMTIFLLLITSRNCMRSTNFLAHNVHKIRHDIEDLNISTRLQCFSLQMLHQQIIIDGFGFFVLNCNMARDVLGSIATYMIFFIQFMPKFKNI